MPLRHGLSFVLVAVLGLFSFGGFAAEDKEGAHDFEVKVKIPAKILKAIKAKWPKAEIEAVEVEEEDGMIVFEFELEEEDGKTEREWTATFTADGKLLETEEEVEFSDLPKSVAGAMKKKYPAVKDPEIEKVTKGDGKGAKVYYEIKFAMEVKIDDDGTVIEEKEIELDEDDDGDDEQDKDDEKEDDKGEKDDDK